MKHSMIKPEVPDVNADAMASAPSGSPDSSTAPLTDIISAITTTSLDCGGVLWPNGALIVEDDQFLKRSYAISDRELTFSDPRARALLTWASQNDAIAHLLRQAAATLFRRPVGITRFHRGCGELQTLLALFTQIVRSAPSLKLESILGEIATDPGGMLRQLVSATVVPSANETPITMMSALAFARLITTSRALLVSRAQQLALLIKSACAPSTTTKLTLEERHQAACFLTYSCGGFDALMSYSSATEPAPGSPRCKTDRLSDQAISDALLSVCSSALGLQDLVSLFELIKSFVSTSNFGNTDLEAITSLFPSQN